MRVLLVIVVWLVCGGAWLAADLDAWDQRPY